MSDARWPKLVFALTLIGTFVAAILPNAAAPDLGDGDKVNHIAAFVTLSVMAAWAWPRAALWRIALGMTALGGAIEAVQAIPILARDAEWADWRADVLATVAALWVVAVVRKLRGRL